MKKYFFIALSILVFMFAACQDSAGQKFTGDNDDLGYDQTFNFYTGTAADTLGSGATSYTYTISKLTDQPVAPVWFLDIDSIDGTAAAVTVTMRNRITPSQEWIDREIVTYNGTADTTFVMTSDTAHAALQWQIELTKAANDFKVKLSKAEMYFPKD